MVYVTSFYQDLVAMILGYNAVILEEDWDDTVHLDNHPVGIGYSICKMQMQPIMNGIQ